MTEHRDRVARRMMRATWVTCSVSCVIGATAHAQAPLDALLPTSAPNCAVTAPPATAGLAATPGGFVLVYPRNDALTDRYTGCKILWLVDTDRMPRLATLYFDDGHLARAVAHDVRDPSGAVEGACAVAEARSLLPSSGRRFSDEACRGFAGESLYALRVPTYPRMCMTNPDEAVCRDDPR